MRASAVVYLVGAGPGDIGLMTTRGADLLRRADVIIYDYLANALLLDLCRPEAEKIYVGKSAGNHTLTQDQTNQLLLDKATALPALDPKPFPLAPRIIVRLKGGDPFVFGRGGEEAAFLRQHHIPVEIVPGVTAGIAGPAYAGIPVTQRNLATTLTLVTGHESEEKGGGTPSLDIPSLSALLKAGGTVVFYMGVKNLRRLAEEFAAATTPDLPAAVIQWATHARQKTVTGTLASISDAADAAGIKPPAIILFGQVVALREKLNWFEERPLFGKKILVTRTRQQASELSARLTELGADVLEAPTIEISPPAPHEWEEIDKTLSHLPAYDWIVFTSANGVRAAWDRLRHLTFDARHFGASSVAAVGTATARALLEIGIAADVVPEKFVGDELAKVLKDAIGQEELRGKRILMLRADIARPTLKTELEKLGAVVEDVAIYQTGRPASLPAEVTTAIDHGQIEWITFTSASTAKNLWELLDEPQREKVKALKRVSIGSVTSKALEELGWKATAEAQRADIEGVIEAILLEKKSAANQ